MSLPVSKALLIDYFGGTNKYSKPQHHYENTPAPAVEQGPCGSGQGKEVTGCCYQPANSQFEPYQEQKKVLMHLSKCCLSASPLQAWQHKSILQCQEAASGFL